MVIQSGRPQKKKELVEFVISKGYTLCSHQGNSKKYKEDKTSLSFLGNRTWLQRLFDQPHRGKYFPGTFLGLNLAKWTLHVHGNGYLVEMQNLADEVRIKFDVPIQIVVDGPKDLLETFDFDKAP